MPKTNTIILTKEFHYKLDSEAFIYQGNIIPLRYKEKRFCTLILKNINNYVSFETIYDYVWEGEIKENYPLRQLVAELKKKLPLDVIHTKMKTGYIISSLNHI